MLKHICRKNFGASKVELEGRWELEELELLVSGAGKLECEELVARNLVIRQSGASLVEAEVAVEKLDMVVEGTSKMDVENIGDRIGSQLTLKVSGASKIDLGELPCDQVDLKVAGACKVKVFPVKRLKAEVAGASKVLYDGSSKELQKDISTMGVSSVKAF